MADEFGALWVDPNTGLSVGGVPVGPSGRPRIQIGNSSPTETEEAPNFWGALAPVMDKLLGTHGQPRHQLWPEQMVRSIWGGLTLPGDLATGEAQMPPLGLRREDVTDIPAPDAPTADSTALGRWLNIPPRPAEPGDEVYNRANDLAGTVIGGGMPMAEKGAAGIFGGKLAAGADQAALTKAQQMAAAGADRAAIWNDTGWFQGVDGQWRFEIPDNRSAMSTAAQDRLRDTGESTGMVASQFRHPDAYEAYPHLRELQATGQYTPEGRNSGYFDGREIGYTATNMGEARQTMLHELQHGVQSKEGFARGGSPQEFHHADTAQLARDALSYRKEIERLPPDLPPNIKDAMIYDQYKAIGAEDWLPSPEARELAHQLTDPAHIKQAEDVVRLYGLDRRVTPYSPKEAYSRLAGEVESRNVQTRADMSPEERRAKPPWETQSVPDAEQIIAHRDGGFSIGRQQPLTAHPDGRYAIAGPDMSKDGMFRLTRFDEAGPVGHTEHGSLAEAIDEGLRGRYQPVRDPSADYMKMLDLGENAPLSSQPIQRMVPEGAEHATPARPAAPEPAGPGAQPGGSGGTGRGNRSLAEAQAEAARIAGADAPLSGLPQKPIILNGDYYVPGPIASIRDVARDYMASTGREYNPPTKYHPVDPEHAKAIAQAFEDMPHAPNDPAVKASYNALIDETLAQYRAMKKAGVKVEPIPADMPDPYAANPRLAAKDVADNNHLWFFPTDQGFGSGGAAGANHPMLRKTGEKIGDHELLANDVFRIVHDYFGHLKEGVGFRAAGEDNAFRIHSSMYSDLARPAMTTETRGQNSWVNYGPHGEKNRTASAADTIYADQKVGIMPEWTTRDRGSPEPIIAYHGTPHDIAKFDISKVGTGEGNQAFGHGLYFAENEKVAKGYRDQLAVWKDTDLLKKHGLDEEDGAYVGRIIASANGDTGQAFLNVQNAIKEIKDEMASGNSRWGASDRAALARLEKTASYILDKDRAKGHTYQVALDINPDHVLDLDLPMSKQTPHVRERLAPIIEERRTAQQEALRKQAERGTARRKPVELIDPETTTGSRAYQFAGLPAKDMWEGNVKSSQRLRDLGIPALRYNDAGSRGLDSGGTRNMVVLDDRLIRILKKYGLIAAPAGTALFGFAPEREQ